MTIHKILEFFVASAKVHDLALGSIEWHLPFSRLICQMLQVLREKVTSLSTTDFSKKFGVIGELVHWTNYASPEIVNEDQE